MSTASNRGIVRMKYRTIVADPPWEYDGFASDPTAGYGTRQPKRWRGVKAPPPSVDSLPYESLSVDEIRKLCPLPWANPTGCRLFLWTTSKYLPHALDLVECWGFHYRQTLVWHKTGNPSPFGGSVAPNHAEFLVVSVTGSPPVLTRAGSSVMAIAAQRRHSQKPDAFLDLIEQVSPGPYLELFARRQRLGWDTWGNEALEHVELSPFPRPIMEEIY